jgi:hypothetical protein
MSGEDAACSAGEDASVPHDIALRSLRNAGVLAGSVGINRRGVVSESLTQERR